MSAVVEVFPFVPVTPTVNSEAAQGGGAGGGRTWLIAREKRPLCLGERRQGYRWPALSLAQSKTRQRRIQIKMPAVAPYQPVTRLLIRTTPDR
jgi:hypothetical protein